MVDFLHNTGCPLHATGYLPPGNAACQRSPDSSKEPGSGKAALREHVRLAALGTDVGTALTQGETLPEMLHRCAEAVVQHLQAALARIWTLNPEENMLELQASAGMYTHLDGRHSRIPVGQLNTGRLAPARQPHLTNTVRGAPCSSDQEWARREGMVACAGYPLTVDHRLVGVLGVFARLPLTHVTLEVLASIASTIALGIARKRVEAVQEQCTTQLRQARNMATIGTQAGGMAHDFNNILGTILGYAELVLDEVPSDHSAYRHTQRMLTAGNRAKELVRHILALSHTSDLSYQPVRPYHNATSVPLEQPTEPPPRGQERILLVDDEAALSRVWQHLLENHGYTVQACASGSEALSAFAAAPQAFDLVITDQTMPHLTGEALALEIHRMRPEIPIILCTGLSHTMTEAQAAALGIQALVMKPLTFQELSQVIRRVLEQTHIP